MVEFYQLREIVTYCQMLQLSIIVGDAINWGE